MQRNSLPVSMEFRKSTDSAVFGSSYQDMDKGFALKTRGFYSSFDLPLIRLRSPLSVVLVENPYWKPFSPSCPLQRVDRTILLKDCKLIYGRIFESSLTMATSSAIEDLPF